MDVFQVRIVSFVEDYVGWKAIGTCSTRFPSTNLGSSDSPDPVCTGHTIAVFTDDGDSPPLPGRLLRE